jgi:hypothetical protein
MRVLILAFSVLGILVSTDAAKAGPSTTTRDVSASVDPAIFTDEATQETEDRIGLDKGKRRDVQRRLTRLGFDTKVNGRFDAPTRAVITRWQSARGYANTGFFNTPQHQALHRTRLPTHRTPKKQEWLVSLQSTGWDASGRPLDDQRLCRDAATR